MSRRKNDNKELEAVVFIMLLVFLMPIAGLMMMGSKRPWVSILGIVVFILGVIVWIKIFAG